MNKNYVFNSNKKLLHVYICCARPNGRTVRHIMISLCEEYLNICIFYMNCEITFKFFFHVLYQMICLTCFFSTVSQQTLPTPKGENNNITPISRSKLPSMQEISSFHATCKWRGKKIKKTMTTAQRFTRCKYLINDNWNLPFFEIY